MSKIATNVRQAKKSGTPVRKPLLEAFDALAYELSRVEVELANVEKATDSLYVKPNEPVKDRINALADSFNRALAAAGVLKAVINRKRPGGAPMNRYRSSAYAILLYQYLKDSSVLKASKLHEELLAALPEDIPTSDADGKEVFSLRIAREERKYFLDALYAPPPDKN